MSNPTRQEIIDAYTAVTTLARLAEEFTPVRVEEHKEINDLHLAVRAALPPIPRPTMAEVEWDDDKHYLAEAQHPVWGMVVMLNYDADRVGIQYICYEKPGRTGFAFPENLTPTGYQCTLKEVHDA